MKTQLILLRHGQPELQGCLLGQTDSDISDLGWQQMQLNCLMLKDVEHVVTSSLVRCKKFALHYALENKVSYECVDDFKECDFGDWDGISYQVLNEKHSLEFTQYLDLPSEKTPPGGEFLGDFNQRIDRALNNLLDRYKGKKILLVSHGGVIRSLVAWCLKMDRLSSLPFRAFSIDYASRTHIDIYHGNSLFTQLQSLNQSINASA